MEGLNTDIIASLLHKINMLDVDQVAPSDINNLNAECSSILIDAAKEPGFIKDIKPSPLKKNCKLNTNPWFNNKCQNNNMEGSGSATIK